MKIKLLALILAPLCGYFMLRFFASGADHAVWLLMMLQFAAPPGLAIAVFAQQHGYEMKFIPAACLISYILCLLTVPFFVALAP